MMKQKVLQQSPYHPSSYFYNIYLKLLFTKTNCPGFSTHPEFSTISGHKSRIEHMSGNEICQKIKVVEAK